MTPEKRAKLLHYAADNPDARFISKKYNDYYELNKSYVITLESLIDNQHFNDWEIYEEPNDEVGYDFVRVGEHKTLESVKGFSIQLENAVLVKITKSPNGEVKVEVVK